jgi:hypothetical protein
MNDFFTFIILSNINSQHSVFSGTQRFVQTLETIHSIRIKVPNSKIIFCDNSNIELTHEQKSIIKERVDKFIEYENNFFNTYVNTSGNNKGINELFLMKYVLSEAKKSSLIGKRIFKISGRYRLSDDFNIEDYSNLQFYGKYAFTINRWMVNNGDGRGELIYEFYNTALWSMCETLINEYVELLQNMFEHMLIVQNNIEMTHVAFIPKEKSIFLSSVKGCGFMTNGQFVTF